MHVIYTREMFLFILVSRGNEIRIQRQERGLTCILFIQPYMNTLCAGDGGGVKAAVRYRLHSDWACSCNCYWASSALRGSHAIFVSRPKYHMLQGPNTFGPWSMSKYICPKIEQGHVHVALFNFSMKASRKCSRTIRRYSHIEGLRPKPTRR